VSAPKVAVLMGSDSDLPQMRGAIDTLRRFEIPFEARVLSAHRTPDELDAFLRDEGPFAAVIAGAGGAAHLAGAVAAKLTVPVIGVPLAAGPLQGFDALLATAQMPPGIPVATVSVGSWGATNAALLVAQILGLSDPAMAERVREDRLRMRRRVAEKNAALLGKLRGDED
jgi:5-(carboxyamino)imidazole ribonucleotide mutase